MEATGLTSVVRRLIFVPLNQNGCPKVEPNFFRARLVKYLRPGWETHFKPILILLKIL